MQNRTRAKRGRFTRGPREASPTDEPSWAATQPEANKSYPGSTKSPDHIRGLGFFAFRQGGMQNRTRAKRGRFTRGPREASPAVLFALQCMHWVCCGGFYRCVSNR
jgi:hypothetical protein